MDNKHQKNRIEPKLAQESVWDYPRPPRLEISGKQLQIVFNNVIIADTNKAYRVLETSHPPVYYLPPQDVKFEYLKSTSQTSIRIYRITGFSGFNSRCDS